MNMGLRLKELRLQKGVTQEEVGKVIGVSKATIMKYEKGIVENLKRSSIEKLANYFNVKPSYLMCMEDDSLEISDLHTKISNFYGKESAELLEAYNKLNKKGKEKAVENIKDLTKISDYTCPEKETKKKKNA